MTEPMDKTPNRHISHIWPCELVLALGPGWVSCEDAIPWNDYRSELRYVVYSPPYGGDLLTCRFDLGERCWWHEEMGVFINGVTHWRLAVDVDQAFGTLNGPPPDATQVNAEKLAMLKYWWKWYSVQHGIDL